MPTKVKPKETAGLTSFMDQAEIDGFVVREWTTQQFCQLYPSLKTILDKMIADGVTIDTFDQDGMMQHLPALTDAIVPIMPDLIRISCPEKTEEEFNVMKWPVSIALTMAILKKNMEHLTDFFGNAPS
jgi:hypothetical protein